MASYKIPDKFKFRNRTWRVKLIDGQKDKENPFYGKVDEDEQIIYLSKIQSPELLLVTFVHELLHLILPNQIVTHQREEQLIDNIDENLVVILNTVGLMGSTDAHIPKDRRRKSSKSTPNRDHSK